MSEQRSISLSGQQPQQQGPSPGEFGYVPPVELVPLPSRGMLYAPGHPFHAKEVVEIRAMTAHDEDILTSRALIKQGKVVSVLIKSCLMSRDVDPDSLLTGDRNAIAIALRITGYGERYHALVDCPICGERCKGEFDLSKLPIAGLGMEPVAPFTNAFPFRLPVSGKDVVFKLMTGADERELEATAQARRRIRSEGAPQPDAIDSSLTERLVHQVVSIGGETARDRVASIVESLPARDSRDLRVTIGLATPRVEMDQDFTCPMCGETTEVDVPIGTELFWPSA